MKKIKLIAVTLLVVMAGTFLLTNENLFKADEKDVVIEEGVFIGGIDVGGMTAEEATTAVDTYVAGIQEQWITLEGPKNTLRYQLSDLGLSAKTSVAVKEAVAVGNSGSLIKRFKSLQDLEKENYVVDMGLSIDKQLTANKIYEKRSKIDIKAIDNSVRKEKGEFVYVPGQEGNEVDIVTAVNELNEYIGTEWEVAAVENAKFALTSVVSQPRGTEEELSVIKDLLGTFSTVYKGSNWGRNTNVETGTAKMDGTILFPGDVFSVYECVSPFTKENGYELAGTYSNGETVQSYGGGICQVTTTLYQAALRAELEVMQRFNHSMIVGYTPPGGDAAIAGTYKDLKFKNNYDFPILIDAKCQNGNIVIKLYGVETRAKNRKVTFESEVLSEKIPETEFTLSADLPIGTYNQTKGQMIGYVANYWKVVTVDGVQTEKTLVNKSTYRPSARKVTIGTGGATAEQIAAINAAIAVARETKDDSGVQALVASFAAPTTTEPAPNTGTGQGTTTPTPNTGTNQGGTTGGGQETTPTPGINQGTTTPEPEKPTTPEPEKPTTPEEPETPDEGTGNGDETGNGGEAGNGDNSGEGSGDADGSN